MEIRKSNRNDLDKILRVYESARQYMLEHGNPSQWIGGYPKENIIQLDIENCHHYICVEDDHIGGCFAFIEGEDSTYKEIFKGKWLNNDPYAVIHRIAVLEQGKGVGSICIDWCISRCKTIKVDTHKNNISMQRLLIKKGFQLCGMIYNQWGDERLAFHKV